MRLRVHAVTRRYGAVVALDDVSLEARPGEIVGVLGANGAGKSTLMRIVAGLLPPDAGRVEIDGLDLGSASVAAKRRMGYAAEEPAFYEELSADEYLAFVSSVRQADPATARARTLDLLERLDLRPRAGEPVHDYSHGMRKKLSFVAAVLHRPQLLLCDEALEGFDATGSLAAKEEIRALAADGSAVVFSSHVTETVERLCHRVVVLQSGRVARELDRSTWGDPAQGPSPLEREFLSILGSARETRRST